MSTRILHIGALATLVAMAGALAANAQSIPKLVSFQGRLTAADGEPLASGIYQVKFELFGSPDPGNVAVVWGATYSVVVVSGQFNVILGAAGGTPVPGATVTDLGAAFAGEDRYLQMTVLTDNAGNDLPEPQILLPRQQILSAPYALTAANISAAGNIGIGTSTPIAPLHVHGGLHLSGTVQDISVQSGEHLQIGHWDGETFLERMRIRNDGRVGIGTASPSTALHVAAPEPVLTLQDSDSTGAAQTGYIRLADSGGSERAWMGYGSSDNAHFTVNNRQTGGNIVLSPGSGGTVHVGASGSSTPMRVFGDTTASTFTATGSGAGSVGRFGLDNSVVAWARVNADGTVQRSVGLASPGVTKASGSGRYFVSIASGMTASTTLIPVVTPHSDEPRFATVVTTSPTGFTVRIWRLLSGNPVLTDTTFVFIVTGR